MGCGSSNAGSASRKFGGYNGPDDANDSEKTNGRPRNLHINRESRNRHTDRKINETINVRMKKDPKKTYQMTINLKTAFEKGTKSGVPLSPEKSLLRGDPDVNIIRSARIVRIFTSSTFTDTKHERNELMKNVYPKLKEFCQGLNYDFQIVDMRWGVGDDAEDEHSVTDLCIDEIRLCQQLSTGPYFVTFLSHKYGYRPLPKYIAVDEFEKITDGIESGDKDFVQAWYKVDDNSIPPVRVLQPISSLYPLFISEDQDVKASAKDSFSTDYTRLQMIFRQNAHKINDPYKEHEYFMSVTEKEIREGLARGSAQCFWFQREITDIDKLTAAEPPLDEKELKELSRYYEYSSEEAQGFLRHLKTSLLNKALKPSHIMKYNISWDRHGINPDNLGHKEYLDQLCDDFEKKMKKSIGKAAKKSESSELHSQLVFEILQHESLKRRKSTAFHGRKDVLQMIKAYVQNTATVPLMLYGKSGCGKTAIMAKAIEETQKWTDKKAVVIYRFIGTTQSSSSIRPLLRSISEQILEVYADGERLYTGDEMNILMTEFELYLHNIPKERPLVIYLDSLDQLDELDGGRQLDWLPKVLPAHAKLVLSTLPEDKYGCLSRSKAIYPGIENHGLLPVSNLPLEDLDVILQSWLSLSKRKLTDQQQQYFLEVTKANPIPLFFKLCFDSALLWRSYDPPSITSLQSTVTELINYKFNRLEIKHGKLLVEHLLRYMTAANGLTSGEIQDLLSLADPVLNVVYRFWTPPIRRLPPLLEARINHDMEEFVVTKGADGVQIQYWYHRQFEETAKTRYLKDPEVELQCHRDLAEYFQGMWSDQPKPYVSVKGEKMSELRHVAAQPLMTRGKYNLRKLSRLPYHLTRSKNLATFKTEVLGSYPFLLGRLLSSGLRALLADLKMAQMTFTSDRDISFILETLQLSSDILGERPSELAGQLIARCSTYSPQTLKIVAEAKDAMDHPPPGVDVALLKKIHDQLVLKMSSVDEKNKVVLDLLQQARYSEKAVLVPHMSFLDPPGGQLFHKMYGHYANINCIAIDTKSTIMISGSDDSTIKIWNLETGIALHTFEMPAAVKSVLILPTGRLLVSCDRGHVILVNRLTGSTESTLENQTEVDGGLTIRPVAVAVHNKKVYVVALRKEFLDIYDGSNGRLLSTLPDELRLEKTRRWSEEKVISGGSNFVIYCSFADDDFYILNFQNGVPAGAEKVNVFEKEAAYGNLGVVDHIKDMAVVENSDLATIYNGTKNEFLVYNLLSKEQIYVLPSGKKKVDNLSYFCPAGSHGSVLFSAGTFVGVLDVHTRDIKFYFKHPFDICRLCTSNGRFIITVAADNVIRIWDRTMAPFAADVSEFTGKVVVGSANTRKLIDAEFHDVVSSSDLEAVVTDKDVDNYWTRDPSKPPSKATTRILPFTTSRRYACVMQNCEAPPRILQWTICLSIFDLSDMSCVRRMFLAEDQAGALDSMYVHCMLGDDFAVVEENGAIIKFKVLCLQKWTLTPITLAVEPRKVWRRIVHIVPNKDLLVVEAAFDKLAIVDPLTSTSVRTHILVVPENIVAWHFKEIKLESQYYTPDMTRHKFNKILSCKGDTIVTLWGQAAVLVWNFQTGELLNTVKLNEIYQDFDPLVEAVTLTPLFTEEPLVLLTTSVAMSSKVKNKERDRYSSLIDYSKGKVREFLKKNEKVDAVDSTYFVLRENPNNLDKPGARLPALRWIGLTKEGKGSLLIEAKPGEYVSKIATSLDGKKCVAWSTSPHEKAIQLWRIEKKGALTISASFTMDNEVDDVLFTAGSQIIVNSSVGLIKLQLTNAKLDTYYQNEPELYKGKDMNVYIIKSKPPPRNAQLM